jgi:hypothetical protein
MYGGKSASDSRTVAREALLAAKDAGVAAWVIAAGEQVIVRAME